MRDYGEEGQWGLEPDFREYLSKMRSFMKELKRVVKKTGSVWINLGDSYSANESSRSEPLIQHKSRFGIPERFYAQCIDDGWIARNHIPWIKANSMPSSVKDRFTNKWESIFFFAKSQQYYFNLDAVREKPVTETKPFNLRVRDAKKGLGQLKLGDDPRAWKMSEKENKEYNEKGERKQDNVLGKDGKPKVNYKGFNDRWKTSHRKSANIPSPQGTTQTLNLRHSGNYDLETGECLNNPKGKNPGDVFYINPRPFPEAHFATFPVDLPLKILKCACPPNGFVLDPFFGAGTVGVAAEKLSLQWIGIELKPEYIKLARKRLESYKNQRLDNV